MRDRLNFELTAPIVISGRVLETVELGSPRPSQHALQVLLQLTRLKVEVEEVIKGDVPTRAVEIYLFKYSEHNKVDLGVPRYVPIAGQHRIYFLRIVDGVYRSVGDVANYNLAVRSGYHEKGFCNGRQRPGCCIAGLLLTPGRDLDAQSFAGSLREAEYVGSVLCGSSVSLSLVRELIDNNTKAIASSAADLLLSLAASGKDRGNHDER